MNCIYIIINNNNVIIFQFFLQGNIYNNENSKISFKIVRK